MHAPNKRGVNIYKWLVFVWAGHKAFKLGRALMRARRLKKKSINQKIVNMYEDL